MGAVITADHFDGNDNAETFKIRSSVTAVRCPDGASVVDDDGKVAARYNGPCYVVEGDDGDHRIVSAYVFDGLYDTSKIEAANDEGADDDPADPTPPASPRKSTARKSTAGKGRR